MSPADWSRSPFTGDQSEAPAQYAYLLDFDHGLAQELNVSDRPLARLRVTARVRHAEVGEQDLTPWFEAVAGGPGLLILEGLVAFQTEAGHRTATELLGAGDLLIPPIARAESLIERVDRWRILGPTRLALLDEEFAERTRAFPEIVYALLRRSGRRLTDIGTLRTITCQPRLEVRLVLLLWHFATRWGRVDGAGIRISLPLTHQLLGQLVAAERPSISHALRRLADAGLVTGSAFDLYLHGIIEDHLALLKSTPARAAEGRGPNPRG